MPTSYPGSLDSLPRPGASSPMNVAPYRGSVVIDNISDAIEALEAKLGIGASTPIANRILRGSATGTATWAQLAAGDIAAGAIATADLAAGAVTQSAVVQGVTSNPTTTSTTPVDMTDMSISMTTVGGKVLLFFVGEGQNNTAGHFNEYGIWRDAGSLFTLSQPFPTANGIIVTPLAALDSPSAGAHTFKVRWNVTAGTGTMVSIVRTLIAVEFKR